MSTTTPVCTVVRPSQQFDVTYVEGISAERVGSTGVCMHLLTLPPGARAKAHLHEAHETAIYIISGESEMWYGEGLKEHLTVRARELLYIPANTPHLPMTPRPRPVSVCWRARPQ